MPGLRFGGARTTVQRLYPHPPHQRLDMPTADLAPLGSQQAAQHTQTGEGKLQMQPVEPLHDHEVGGRHRTRQIIDTAALIFKTSACLVIDRSCSRSIIALRSAIPPCERAF